MRLLNPVNRGPIVAEKIIYVDAPDVREKYQAEIKQARDHYEAELQKLQTLIKLLEDKSTRQEFQIKNYVELMGQRKAAELSGLVTPESNQAQAEYIEKLKKEITSANAQLIELKRNVIIHSKGNAERDHQISELEAQIEKYEAKAAQAVMPITESAPDVRKSGFIALYLIGLAVGFLLCLGLKKWGVF